MILLVSEKDFHKPIRIRVKVKKVRVRAGLRVRVKGKKANRICMSSTDIFRHVVQSLHALPMS